MPGVAARRGACGHLCGRLYDYHFVRIICWFGRRLRVGLNGFYPRATPTDPDSNDRRAQLSAEWPNAAGNRARISSRSITPRGSR
jgi:hypothetical protein